MDLQHIDVRAESLDAGLDSVHDVLAGQACAVGEFTCINGDLHHVGRRCRIVLDTEEAFTQDHEAITWDAVLLDRFLDKLLAPAVGVDVCLQTMV